MTHAKYLALSPDRLAEMRRLWSAGLPTWAIAEDTSLSKELVQSAARGLDFPHRDPAVVAQIGREREEGRQHEVVRASHRWRTRYVSPEDAVELAERCGVAWSGARGDLVALNAALSQRNEPPIWVLGLRA